MIRTLLTLFFFALALTAATEEVRIASDRFEADEKAKVTKFIGHVHMQKGGDELNASKVVVYFDKNNKPVRYEALGKTSFVIVMEKGQRYTGKADKLVYLPRTRRYELYGDVVLREPALDRTVRGEKVIVEKASGKALVEGGSDKPVRFIFQVEENNGQNH
ncbi:lipopolysaccharide transport periplasmic protein LptA [Hydrogenimonas sp.]